MATVGWLITGCVVILTVLQVLHLWTVWRWDLKAAAIAIAFCACLLAYFSAPALLGWPTAGKIPAKFNLLGVMIEEPDAQRDAPGAIYFWGSDLAPGSQKTPRAYRVPYTQTLKAEFSEAHGKMRKNIPQVGEADDSEAPKGVAADRSELGQTSLKIKIKDAPAEGAPVKDAPQ